MIEGEIEPTECILSTFRSTIEQCIGTALSVLGGDNCGIATLNSDLYKNCAGVLLPGGMIIMKGKK